MLGVVAHACNPSTLGGGDGRIRVHSQPQLSLSLSLSLLSEALRNFVRPGFKIKYKNQGQGCSAEVERPWVQSPVPQKNWPICVTYLLFIIYLFCGTRD